jgi:hypothetical protein
MRKLARLGIALMGVWSLVGAISALWYPLTVATLNTGELPKPLAVVMAVLPALATAAVGVFLVFGAAWIADRLVPDVDVSLGVAPDALLRVGLILAGLLLVADGAPTFIRYLVTPVVDIAIAAAQAGGNASDLGLTSQLWRSVPYALAALVSVGIGWFLVARSAQLTRRLLGPAPASAEDLSRSLSTCPSCGAEYDPADYVGGLAEPRCSVCSQPLPHV